MKRLLVFGLMAVLVAISAAGVQAVAAPTWVIYDNGLQDTANFTQQFYPGDGGLLVSRSDTAGNPGTNFVFSLSGTGFAKSSVGDDYPVTAATGNSGDLTAYSQYKMCITNPNASGWFAAQLFVNTGYVPTPGDHPYSSAWVWFAPGETKTLILDLAGMEYLNEVTNIGFRIGSNIGTGEQEMPADTLFNVGVVPEPSAVASLIMGVTMLSGTLVRRRRS